MSHPCPWDLSYLLISPYCPAATIYLSGALHSNKLQLSINGCSINLLWHLRHIGLCSPVKSTPSSSYSRQVCGCEKRCKNSTGRILLGTGVLTASFSVYFSLSMPLPFFILVVRSSSCHCLLRKLHGFLLP